MDGDHRSSAATRSPRPRSTRSSRPARASASLSRGCCSSPTWCSPAPAARARPASKRSPRPPSAASGAPSPPPCPASSSSPAARATSRHRAPERDERLPGRARGRSRFSYGRALQAAALQAWGGNPDVSRRPAGVRPPGPAQRPGPPRPIHARTGATPRAEDFAILVGGGPAPGINAVIAAATIEARNQDSVCSGAWTAQRLMQGTSTTSGSSKSRASPDPLRRRMSSGPLARTRRGRPRPSGAWSRSSTARRLLLLTIGGTTPPSRAAGWPRASAAGCVVHVPKTIDNDFPLPRESRPSGSRPLSTWARTWSRT